MLQVRKIKEDKHKYLPLLQLSGLSQEKLEEALPISDLYVLSAGQINVSAALVQVQEDQCVILAIATDLGHRNMGYAARLVDYLKDDYARRVSSISIKVAPSQTPVFYRLGFYKAEECNGQNHLMKNLKELD